MCRALCLVRCFGRMYRIAKALPQGCARHGHCGPGVFERALEPSTRGDTTGDAYEQHRVLKRLADDRDFAAARTAK